MSHEAWIFEDPVESLDRSQEEPQASGWTHDPEYEEHDIVIEEWEILNTTDKAIRIVCPLGAGWLPKSQIVEEGGAFIIPSWLMRNLR